MEYLFQNYCWFVVVLTIALITPMLFVSGGQSMIYEVNGKRHTEMNLLTFESKWYYALLLTLMLMCVLMINFPLLFATCIGGAYWMWILLALCFLMQGTAYKFRLKVGNVLGRSLYKVILFVTGIVIPLLLGNIIGHMFFGGDYVISHQVNDVSGIVMERPQWGAFHGLESLTDIGCLLLGFMLLFYSRMLANFWLLKYVDDAKARKWNRTKLNMNAPIFLALLIAVVSMVIAQSGYEVMSNGEFQSVDYKYVLNIVAMPQTALFIFVSLVLFSVALCIALFFKKYNNGFQMVALGGFCFMLGFMMIAAFNNTSFYPSLRDINSSLCISNSCADESMLGMIFVESVLFVILFVYSAWIWKKTTKKVTQDDL